LIRYKIIIANNDYWLRHAGNAFTAFFLETNMANRIPQAPQLDLSRSRYEKPLFVDMEAFFDFSFWISEELLDLEARFKPKNQPRLQNALETASSLA